MFLLIFCLSLLKKTYHYNYRSHISLQVAKLAKSAGGQILIFPTVQHHTCVKPCVGSYLDDPYSQGIVQGYSRYRAVNHNWWPSHEKLCWSVTHVLMEHWQAGCNGI